MDNFTLGNLVEYISKKESKQSIQPFFKRDDFVLYNMDSIELMNLIPDNSIDMIFSDPPYKLSNGGFTCQNGQMVSVNKGNGISLKALKLM